jgi:hypothetical protein
VPRVRVEELAEIATSGSGQAEAAEVRASHAEREREAAARIAVAEERTGIAREIYDIVAHAVSVMVLQVGAVRHKLPETLPEDREALEGVEQTGRTALAEMRQLLGAMRRDGDDLAPTPQPGLRNLNVLQRGEAEQQQPRPRPRRYPRARQDLRRREDHGSCRRDGFVLSTRLPLRGYGS